MEFAFRPGNRAPAAAAEVRSVEIDGLRLAYTVSGSGPAAVLIHGLAGSGRWWDPVVPDLARDHTVHVLDLVGFGASARQPFVLEGAATQIARFMDMLGIGRALVVGHSMGGLIAAELAADRPDLVERLVLVDACGLPFRQSLVQHAVNLVRSTLTASPSFLALSLVDTLRAGPLTLVRATRAVLRSDLSSRLARIEAPTLVLWGEHDPLIPADTGRALARALANGSFAIVEGAGHSPMWERPERFSRRLRSFMRACRAPVARSTAALAA